MRTSYVLFSASIIFLALNLACIRSYNASPVTSVTLGAPIPVAEGVELKAHAFLKQEEIEDKFGKPLACEHQVIPIQVCLSNQSQMSYRVTRASFVLIEENGSRMEALTLDQAYQLGHHTWDAPIVGLFLCGPLAIPCAYTTSKANAQLQADYKAKMLNEAILEPGKETSGVLFFDPSSHHHLTRHEAFKLLLELENTNNGSKATLEWPLS